MPKTPHRPLPSLVRLYEHAPSWVRAGGVAVMGAYLHWLRRGGDFRAWLRRAESETFSDPPALQSIRERLWDDRIRAAVRDVDAYGHRDLALRELSSLPVLTKHDVRSRLPAFTRPGVPRWQVVRMHTSGTTGAGMPFVVPRHAIRREYAFVWRYRRWHGIQPGEWCATFAGRTVVPPQQREPPFWQENPAGRATLYSQYHLGAATVRRYVEHLRESRVRWIHGYPSFVGLFCRLALDAGLSGRTQVRWVTLSSENVLEQQRSAIRQMFGVEPRQQYGSTDSVAMASECPQGRLHVDEDYSHVELLPSPDDPARSRIVGTTLDNDAFPLVRYDLGDVVEVATGADATCPCGRHGRVLRSIDGRREDLVVLRDGSRIGRISGIFMHAANVKEAQIVQRRPGVVVLRIVRGATFSGADEMALRREIQGRVGGLLDAEFEYLDAIPRTASGKLRLVVSEIPEGRISS